MRFQTIPSTVPDSPPSTVTELAQTGAPEWLPLLIVVGILLLFAGAALVRSGGNVHDGENFDRLTNGATR